MNYINLLSFSDFSTKNTSFSLCIRNFTTVIVILDMFDNCPSNMVMGTGWRGLCFLSIIQLYDASIISLPIVIIRYMLNDRLYIKVAVNRSL